MKPLNGFLGKYYVNLDEKGRLNVPSKFKSVIEREDSTNLILCAMGNEYLTVFPQSEWAANEAKMADLSAFDLTDRDRLRDFYSRTAEVEQKSGKILVPKNLRDTIKLNQEIVLVGMSKTFEIWAKEVWDAKFPDNP